MDNRIKKLYKRVKKADKEAAREETAELKRPASMIELF